MRILVTGGGGFIGGHVVDAVRAHGDEPIIFDRHNHGNADVFLGDIRDAVAVEGAVDHADAVIHLAGVLGTQETIDKPTAAVMTNITGMLNVLDAVRLHNVPLVNIAVGNFWMDNSYSISKNTAERLCRMYRNEHGVNVTTVRAMNAYGPRQVACAPYGPSKVRKIMPSFICRALSGIPIEVYGKGDQIMDMVYVTDVAETLVQAIGANGDYECGTGRPTSVQFIAETVLNAVGMPLHLIDNVPMRPGEPEHSTVLADPSKCFDLPALPLEHGVANTVAWFKANEGGAWNMA